MSVYTLKSILAIGLLLSGLGAALAMLISLGRTEKKASPAALRRIHRTAGYLFLLLLLGLSVLGMDIFVDSGQALSTRAVLHAFLALFLLFIVLLKIGLVRFFKSFLRMVPALGLAILVLSLVVFSVSAGYFLLGGLPSSKPASAASPAQRPPTAAGRGSLLFTQRCASCHFSDKEEVKVGPGLKGLFKKVLLPASGRPATRENIRRQFTHPYRSMPVFGSLSEQEIADLIAYLRTI
jgi:mono/diheme cytochrome c family protein